MKTVTLILILTFFAPKLKAQTSCDNFDSDPSWANQTSVSTPGIIGYTQSNSQAVTLLTGGIQFNTYSGMYGTGDVNFDFDGSNQLVNCQIYYLTGQENQFEIAVNGSAFTPISTFFTTSSVSGVVTSLDSTLVNTSMVGFNDAMLSFNGSINTITFRFFESAINELCKEASQLFIGCDDFENDLTWTNLTSFSTPGIIGYTQNNTQPITLLNGGVQFNGYSGMYGTGDVNFDFNGNNKLVNYEIYYMTGQENQFEVAVNGSAFLPISNFFTGSVISGVGISLDSTLMNTSVNGFNDALLTFTGSITNITFRFFESGVNRICIDSQTAGINAPEKELEFSLFPNPANNQITLSEIDFDYLVITDSSGRIVKTQDHSEGKQINLADFSEGIYQLNVILKNRSGKELIVVSH